MYNYMTIDSGANQEKVRKYIDTYEIMNVTSWVSDSLQHGLSRTVSHSIGRPVV